MKRVLFRRRAIKDLEAMANSARDQVESAIERLAQTGQGDVKMLAGADRQFRLRAGIGECALSTKRRMRFESCTFATAAKLTDRG